MSRDGGKGLFSMTIPYTKDIQYGKGETTSTRHITLVARKVLRYTKSWHIIVVLVLVRCSASHTFWRNATFARGKASNVTQFLKVARTLLHPVRSNFKRCVITLTFTCVSDYDDEYTLASFGPPPARYPGARSAATTRPPCASTESGTWFLTWLLCWVVLYSGYSWSCYAHSVCTLRHDWVNETCL
jgi:hypothetical protein